MTNEYPSHVPPDTGWIAEAAEQERTAAGDLYPSEAAAPPCLTVDDFLATIAELGSLAGLLETAAPTDRAHLYARGVTVTYDAAARTAMPASEYPQTA
ncbi:MAG: hypothetical protein ACLPVY_27675 [Acidimicrobiia bacterium]